MSEYKKDGLESRMTAVDTPHKGLFFLALGITFASLFYQEVLKNNIEEYGSLRKVCAVSYAAAIDGLEKVPWYALYP